MATIHPRVYLDYNSTSPLLPGVAEMMSPYLDSGYGNPSSVHGEGRHAKQAVENARNQVAQWLGVRRDKIIFTSGGSEAINTAIKGIAFSRKSHGTHLITTAVEHAAVLETCRYLEREFGFTLTLLPVDSTGLISLEDIKKAVTRETSLISLIHAQNEIGTVEPVEEVITFAHERGIVVHLDGVQAAGKIPLNLGALGADLYSISGHKVGGPKGVGVLYVRDDLKIHPLIHGAHHERDMRAGTENVSGIVGFGKAAEMVSHKNSSEFLKGAALKQKLYEGIQSRVENCFLNGSLRGLPNTLNLSFDGVDGLALLLNLDLEGISVSSGSACLSGGIEPSAILMALGLSKERAQSAIRFSLGWGSTEEEINFTIEKVAEVVGRLRESNIKDQMSK
ncbi:MAG: cysteine desulfurase [Chlamydiae bacterium]|nr:cysteine desulfurase [Chlamydiota bacterium]MBI3277109.1 cysteine desulfurase [Chlamydiota bacterium]